MLNQRQRALLGTFTALAGIWIAVSAGWWFSSRLKVTPEKVNAYLSSVDLNQLTGGQRSETIQNLADKINALSFEDRQRMREEGSLYQWFGQMTEDEKAWFIEATLPTGFKQMIDSFEKLPEGQRQHAIDEALKHLRETNDQIGAGQMAMGVKTNTHPPAISEELQVRVRTLGLKIFYSQTSAQSKAELAPLLEEVQHSMESSGALRGAIR